MAGTLGTFSESGFPLLRFAAGPSAGLLDLLAVTVGLVDVTVDVGGLSLLPGCGSLLPGCGSLLPGCCRPNGFGSLLSITFDD